MSNLYRPYVAEPKTCLTCGWECYEDIDPTELVVGQFQSSLGQGEALPNRYRQERTKDRAKRVETRLEERKRAVAKRDTGETINSIALSLNRSITFVKGLLTEYDNLGLTKRSQ